MRTCSFIHSANNSQFDNWQLFSESLYRAKWHPWEMVQVSKSTDEIKTKLREILWLLVPVWRRIPHLEECFAETFWHRCVIKLLLFSFTCSMIQAMSESTHRQTEDSINTWWREVRERRAGGDDRGEHWNHSNQSHAGKFIRHFLLKCVKHNHKLFLRNPNAHTHKCTHTLHKLSSLPRCNSGSDV